MRVADFLARWGERAPWGGAAEWDRTGLQLGDPDQELVQLALCHEVTEEVVERCELDQPDLLLTYHPLLFYPTTSLRAGTNPAGRAWRLVRAGVNLAVTHTAFDVAAGGMADALAAAIGLEQVDGFGILDGSEAIKIETYVPPEHSDRLAQAITDAGAGKIGLYSGCSFRSSGRGYFTPEVGSQPILGKVGTPESAEEMRLEMIAPASARDRVLSALVAAHPYDQPAFQVFTVTAHPGLVGRVGNLPVPQSLSQISGLVSERICPQGMRTAGDLDRRISRIAVLPGSGSSYLGEAVATGAELFVTGDVPHHRMQSGLDSGLSMIDAGHIPTERPGMSVMVDWARQVFTGDIADYTDIDPTPWR